MIEKEISGKIQIYHIVTSYYNRTTTGHMVMGKSAKEALSHNFFSIIEKISD